MKKFKIEQLKVSSFVTDLQDKELEETIKGGKPGFLSIGVHCTQLAGTGCIHGFSHTVFCDKKKNPVTRDPNPSGF